MKYFVKVTPRAKQTRVEQTSPNTLHVWVHEPPVGGRANDAVRELLADYFGKPRWQVVITAGHTSKAKTVEIATD